MNISIKKKIAIALVLVVVVIFALGLYAISMIDTDRIVRIASTQVKEITGRNLAIKGPVSIKFFPHLAVVAEQVSLSNPNWAADANMIEAKQVSFDLKWRPLLNKRIDIENVTLDQAQLILQAAPASKKVDGNWTLDTSTSSNQNGDVSSSFRFDLAEMHLNQLSLIYKDAQGSVIDTLLLKHFDVRRVGNQNQLDAVMVWNNLPLTLKGKTDLWLPLIEQLDEIPVDFALDLNLGVNKQTARVQGHIKFDPKMGRLVDLKINSAALDMQALSTMVTPGIKKGVAVESRSSNRVFSTVPLQFNALPLWQGQVQADVGTLTLPNGIKLDSFSGIITSTADDTLILKPLSFMVGAGHVIADGRLNAIHSRQPVFAVRGSAIGFNFGQLMTQMGKPNLINGGPTQAAFNIKTRGASVSALAANANGSMQISVGQATVSNSLTTLGGDFLVNVANTINPLRLSTDTSDLKCLVAYLPVKNGLVQIDKTVGMQTERINVTLDGQVNLGPETLKINIYPKERSGLTTGVNPAGLVQITGTLTNPRMGLNKTGVVKQAAGVGLAVVTSGISLLAQNAAGVVNNASPCDNVLRPWSQVTNGL